jgi:UDP-4-amino-4,6-dideoxy-N-acetyl-beta-L-altrosamine N-acetyltransferase
VYGRRHHAIAGVKANHLLFTSFSLPGGIAVLRPASDDDRDLVLGWRNHPEVRAVSLTRHEIGADEHARWWAAAREDPTRQVLVYERRNVPSGVVTFFDHDRSARAAWWGYYLDNAGLGARGELMPAWIDIQRKAIRYAFDDLGLDSLEGEVVAANESVRRLNRRHGFTEVEAYVRDIDGTPTDVIRVRLSSANAG